MKKNLVLAAAVALYFAVFFMQLSSILRRTHGQQVYSLDDPYIHAAVAKNLLLYHVYGVSRFAVSFPCSSILWPFIVTLAFAIVGIHAWVPLVLNVLFSLLYLVLVHLFLLRMAPRLPGSLHFLCLTLMVLAVPLVGMTFIGMEHVLQALSLLLLLYAYSVATSFRVQPLTPVFLIAAAILTVSVRYEGLFAVAVVCLLLARKRRWRLALAMGAISVLPVVAFGIFAISHGGTFLPSPLLLKTASINQLSPLTALRNLFGDRARIGGIASTFIVSAVFWLILRRNLPEESASLREVFTILLGTFVLHAQIAKFGWLFRYEAYLLGATIVVVFASLPIFVATQGGIRNRTWRIALATVGAAVLIGGLSLRTFLILRLTPEEAQAIYEQQFQTAQFLASYYTGHGVALNDIGAPSFFADINCLDLWGLASPEVQRLRKDGELDAPAIQRLAKAQNSSIAVLYPWWFGKRIPSSWVPVATWSIEHLDHRIEILGRSVTLYAVDPADATKLSQAIHDYQPKLPSGIHVEYSSAESLFAR